MKIFKRILVGCLATAVLALLVLAVVAVVMVSLGPPERHPSQASREEPVQGQRLPAADPAPGEVEVPRTALRVQLELEEGSFEVRAGTPGSGVRVEADYDEGLYRLEQESHESGGLQTVRVRFLPRYSALRRLLTLGEEMGNDNRVTVFLPPDVPLALAGRVAKGESRFDLTGVPLTGVDLELRMGSHRISFDEPNPVPMEEIRLHLSMGETELRKLGNARFRAAHLRGSMGEVNLDLRGEWTADAQVEARFSMGELRVEVPAGVRVEPSVSAFLGGAETRGLRDTELPETAPTLRLRASISLGELTVRRR